ncbi:MAG: Rieske 2Fe-2S domain-containing protein [Magnetospirillum sp. WYHS-4]
MTGQVLCRLDDIPDPGSVRVDLTLGGKAVQAMVIRHRGRVAAYVNSCPHVGAPLDLTKGQFLALDRSHILCGNHGALFRIEDGHCIAGPCKGKDLKAIPISLRDGYIVAGGE